MYLQSETKIEPDLSWLLHWSCYVLQERGFSNFESGSAPLKNGGLDKMYIFNIKSRKLMAIKKVQWYVVNENS